MITIKEIAAQANLSIGTVDRVLHGRGRVSKATAERVRAIIEKTGYRANIHASTLSLKTSRHFGVLMPFPRQDGGYWEMLRRGIDMAVAELAAFNVSCQFYFFDKHDNASFRKAGDEALSRTMAGLLVAPVLLDASAEFIASLPPNLPYAYVDSIIPETSPLTMIGQDSFKSGVCGAKLMRLLLGKSGGAVAVLRMLPNDFHINERVRGFLSSFKNGETITPHVFDADSGASDSAFSAHISSIAASLKNCRGIFVTNAETHRVAKTLHGADKQYIIGYDCTEENLRYLDKGAIDFIINQNTREQGYAGINALFRAIVLREAVDKRVLMPIDIVMKENACSYR
jgi:LacI family transcriptional regulator